MKEKVTYLKSKGKYLVMHKNGKTVPLDSEEDFNTYLTTNNCEVEK